MGTWQGIWEGEGASRLWSIPDPDVVDVVLKWKTAGGFQRVLDIGCGPGRHVWLLAQEGFSSYGSDHSRQAIDVCGRILHKGGLTAELWCGEMEEVPYPDGFFDGMIAFNSIYHGSRGRVEGVLQILESKLRSGGEFYLTIPSTANRMYGRGEQIDVDTFRSPGMFDQLFPSDGEKGEPHYFASRDTIDELMSKFEVVSMKHEELRLAKERRNASSIDWLTVSKAFFWRILAKKRNT